MLCKEVKVTGGEMLLTYTSPLLADGTSEERSPVLYFVRPSGPFGTVPELIFEKKGLIPNLQQLLVSKP
jgi:hypothetical protein